MLAVLATIIISWTMYVENFMVGSKFGLTGRVFTTGDATMCVEDCMVGRKMRIGR